MLEQGFPLRNFYSYHFMSQYTMSVFVIRGLIKAQQIKTKCSGRPAMLVADNQQGLMGRVSKGVERRGQETDEEERGEEERRGPRWQKRLGEGGRGGI